MILMRHMHWTYDQLLRCPMSRYRALVKLVNDEARQAGRKR